MRVPQLTKTFPSFLPMRTNELLNPFLGAQKREKRRLRPAPHLYSYLTAPTLLLLLLSSLLFSAHARVETISFSLSLSPPPLITPSDMAS